MGAPPELVELLLDIWAKGAIASAFMSGGEVRVAIAGTGFIGAVHARSARLAGARLVGVAASSPERGLLAAAALGAERSFATAEELVEADDVDVVHICTPNHLHRPLAEAALAAGKHVICEKPLAVDDRGAEEMVEAANSSGLTTAVPFVYRYYPTVREARERIRTGVTGPVRLIHGGYLQDWLLLPGDDNWRVDEHLGGASRAFAAASTISSAPRSSTASGFSQMTCLPAASAASASGRCRWLGVQM